MIEGIFNIFIYLIIYLINIEIQKDSKSYKSKLFAFVFIK